MNLTGKTAATASSNRSSRRKEALISHSLIFEPPYGGCYDLKMRSLSECLFNLLKFCLAPGIHHPKSGLNEAAATGDLRRTHETKLARIGNVSQDWRIMFAQQSQIFRRSEERRVGKECRSRWSPY